MAHGLLVVGRATTSVVRTCGLTHLSLFILWQENMFKLFDDYFQ